MSLLPPNATSLENAIVDSSEQVSNAKVIGIGNLWNAATCPNEFLVYLAWAVDVDFSIYNKLDDQQRREYISKSVEIHRHKGTIGALKKALIIPDYTLNVEEWYSYSGKPHTIKVHVHKLSDGAINTALINDIIHKNKNVQTSRELSINNSINHDLYCGVSSTVTLRIDEAKNKAHTYASISSQVTLLIDQPTNKAQVYNLCSSTSTFNFN